MGTHLKKPMRARSALHPYKVACVGLGTLEIISNFTRIKETIYISKEKVTAHKFNCLEPVQLIKKAIFNLQKPED